MIELLKKYQLLLSFMKISTIDVSKLKSVLELFGVRVNDNVSEIIVSMLHEVAKEKNIDSLGKILADPDVSSQIFGLIDEVSVKSNDVGGDGHGNQDMIHVDSLIPCTHCNKRVHIRSGISLMK